MKAPVRAFHEPVRANADGAFLVLRMHHGDRPNPDDASIEAGLSIDQVKDEVADVHPGAVYLVLVEVVHHAKGKVRRPLSLVACVDALNDCPSSKATRPVGIRLQQQPLVLWGSEKVARVPGDADRLLEKPGTSFYTMSLSAEGLGWPGLLVES